MLQVASTIICHTYICYGSCKTTIPLDLIGPKRGDICIMMVPLTFFCTQGIKLMPTCILSTMRSFLPWKWTCVAISLGLEGWEENPRVQWGGQAISYWFRWDHVFFEMPCNGPSRSLSRSSCNVNRSLILAASVPVLREQSIKAVLRQQSDRIHFAPSFPRRD